MFMHFPSKTIVCDLIEFLITKLFKIQYLFHLRLKNFQINCSKSYSSRAFQQYQKFAQFPF
jgi:hypothetical protein